MSNKHFILTKDGVIAYGVTGDDGGFVSEAVVPPWMITRAYQVLMNADAAKTVPESPLEPPPQKYYGGFDTVEEIADDMVEYITTIDVLYLRNLPLKEDMGRFHHTVGMDIRNNYGLWEDNHPLTAAWFTDMKNNTNDFLIDGIDHHPCHPDAISMQILERIWEKVNESSNT